LSLLEFFLLYRDWIHNEENKKLLKLGNHHHLSDPLTKKTSTFNVQKHLLKLNHLDLFSSQNLEEVSADSEIKKRNK